MKELNLRKAMELYSELMKLDSDIMVYQGIGDDGRAADLSIRKREVLNQLDDATSSLSKEISEVEGRARERRLTANAVLSALRQIEFVFRLPKKDMEGLVVDVDVNAEDFPRAYKYTANSTKFRAVFKNGSWRVVDIERSSCERKVNMVKTELTPEIKEAIIRKFSRFRI